MKKLIIICAVITNSCGPPEREIDPYHPARPAEIPATTCDGTPIEWDWEKQQSDLPRVTVLANALISQGRWTAVKLITYLLSLEICKDIQFVFLYALTTPSGIACYLKAFAANNFTSCYVYNSLIIPNLLTAIHY